MLAFDLLPDINLRYRNSFTDAQKYNWMNDEQNDIFQTFKIEHDPIEIPLVTGSTLYYIPAEIKYIDQIRAATIQMGITGSVDEYRDLPFRRDFNEVQTDFGPWYTIVGPDKFYISIPSNDITGYNAYFFIDQYATPIADDGDTEISVPEKYLEIMKYGVLRRIAEARKDIVMVNNYTNSRNELIDSMLWTAVINEPQWVQPTSNVHYRSQYNRSFVNGW